MRLRASAYALVGLLALAAAGCGDDAAPPVATPDPAPAVEDTPDPEPVDTPTPTPTPEEQTYEVQQGDTLSGIAQRFGVTVQAIVDANDIDDPDSIFPGDVLQIPAE